MKAVDMMKMKLSVSRNRSVKPQNYGPTKFDRETNVKEFTHNSFIDISSSVCPRKKFNTSNERSQRDET